MALTVLRAMALIALLCGGDASAQKERFPPPADWQYNTTRSTREGVLNVHITPHTHDDTGWLMTVDQYYYKQVRFILDSILDALLLDPRRRFNYVEMAFFSRWFTQLPRARRQQVRGLVNSGQLSFLNGGWCMHDEAGPLYVEMVDQTTRGHQFIRAEFGEEAAPRATWSIDPFGHSAAQAWLLSAEAGMPSLFWARMDGDDRRARQMRRALEYVWRGSESRGARADTFGSVLWGSDSKGLGLYSCPLGFEEYTAEQVQDDPRLHDWNVRAWVDRIVKVAREQQGQFQGQHILWACGFDFTHKNANTWFRNTDALMHYVNMDGRVRLLYSSPADYVAAKHAEQEANDDLAFELRRGDLMPLHEFPHVYWTGYFSSRVAFKRLVRFSSNLLNAARHLHLLAPSSVPPPPSHAPAVGATWTDAFEAALSVAMHHDGVSGTAKQNVNGDYAQRIAEAQTTLEAGASQSLRQLLSESDDAPAWRLCPALNMSVCHETAGFPLAPGASFAVLAWNPLAQVHPGFTFRVPVQMAAKGEGEGAAAPVVFGPAGKPLETQLMPLDHRTLELPLLYLNWHGMDAKERQAAHNRLRNLATHELVFQADLPPLGLATFNVSVPASARSWDQAGHATTPEEEVEEAEAEEEDLSQEAFLDNGVYRVTLAAHTREVAGITNLETGRHCALKLDWAWYASSPGGCSEFGCGDTTLGAVSGAYIFRPNSSKLHFPGPAPADVRSEVLRGPLVSEVRTRVSPWASHVVRLEKGKRSVTIEFTAGPIPQHNDWVDAEALGKELVLRYGSCLRSAGVFYTDSNGLEMQRRVRNERPEGFPQTYSWKDEPISSNYYPVNALISIAEGNSSLGVAVDSTMGGASLEDGGFELMVLRRVLHDDFKGVEEPLNETMCGCNGAGEASCSCHGLTVRGTHELFFDSNEARLVNQRLQHRPTLFFRAHHGDHSDPTRRWSALARALPPNVHLLTATDNYAAAHEGRVLVRLQHIYAAGEHDELSEPATVSLRGLFAAAAAGRYVTAKETTLTGNLPVEEKLAYSWRLQGDQAEGQASPPLDPLDPSTGKLTLQPMQIRTFMVQLAKDRDAY